MPKVPKTVADYHVYSYEHVDELAFVLSPSKVEAECHYGTGMAALEPDIAELFLANGWEGDGHIGLMWLPPFVGPWGSPGQLVWFVKQDNNGTAFLASDLPLPYHDLHDDEDCDEEAAGSHEPTDRFAGLIPESIVHVAREVLDEKVEEVISGLELDIAAVSTLPLTSKVASHLAERAQGQMVQELISFLDDAYLRILIEVVSAGNKSKVKLRKSKANLNVARYQPDDFDGDADGFFTLNGLISDLWAAYKFEPFIMKLEMLIKPLDFALNVTLKDELRKHVALRNAVQHHGGWIGKELVESIGRDHVPIVGPNGATRLEMRFNIIFPVEEIRAFGVTLNEFARLLDDHVEKRIASRYHSEPASDPPEP